MPLGTYIPVMGHLLEVIYSLLLFKQPVQKTLADGNAIGILISFVLQRGQQPGISKYSLLLDSGKSMGGGGTSLLAKVDLLLLLSCHHCRNLRAYIIVARGVNTEIEPSCLLFLYRILAKSVKMDGLATLEVKT